MADDYGEVVELGFEGVDRFAEKFHDPVVDFVSKRTPRKRHSKNKKQGKGEQHRQQHQHQQEEQRRDRSPDSEWESRERGMSPRSRQRSPDIAPSDQYSQHLPPPPPGYPPQQNWQNLPPPPPGYPPPPVGYPAQPRSSDLPPHPQQNSKDIRPPPPRNIPPHLQQRSRSLPPDSESDSEGDDRKSMYSSYTSDRRRDDDRRRGDRRRTDDRRRGDRRRDDDWRDGGRDGGRDGARERGYDGKGDEKTVDESAYYGYTPGRGAVAVRDRDANRSVGAGALVPRVPSPPRDSYAPEQYGVALATRGRPAPPRQRSSTWSPPRRDKGREESDSRRVRSKSPNHYRAAAVIIGALAGGVAGSRVKHQDPIPNTISTVAGAIIGSLGAREAEKAFDRHKTKRRGEDERDEQRERRRREREH